jgi:drug/metabolite transporter superfamily protein YnfA
MEPNAPVDFEKVAAQHRTGNVLTELWLFLRENKKWWLLPIVLVLLLFGLLVILSSTAAAPFIYTLF